MERDRLRAMVVLVLAVTAIAAAGAAVDDGTAGGGSPGVGSGEGAGIGDGDEGGLVPISESAGQIDGGDWFGHVVAVLYTAAFLVLAALFVRSVLRREWRTLLTVGGLVALVVALAVVTGIGIQQLSEVFEGLFGTSGSPGGLGGPEGVGIGGAESGGGVDLPLGALLALIGAAFVGALLLAYVSRSSDAEEPPDADGPAGAPLDPESPSSSGSATPHAVAGADVPADNDVYRAWLALVEAGDADPSRDSPATVARRAADAGVDERVVDDVTALFEEVRYGGAPVTPERERRAASAVEQLGGASR